MIYNYAASTRHQNLCKISRPKLLGSILQICLLQSVIKWYSGEMVPRGTPLPMRHAHSPFAAAQRAPCQKRGFDAARYQVARKRGSARHFLFRTTFGVRLSTRLEQIFCVLLRLSERSGTIEVHLATLSAQNLRKIFRSMLRDYVYLIGSMPTFNNLVAVI